MTAELQEVHQSFVHTSQELLERCEVLLLGLEQGYQQDNLSELLRHIHTIKGNSSIFGYSSIMELCHAFEGFLAQVQKWQEPLGTQKVDLGLTVIDCLRQQITQPSAGDGEEIARLKRQLTQVHTPPPPR